MVRWKQICSLPEKPLPDSWIWSDTETKVFYTDGTTFFGNLPSASIAFWSIVVDTALSDAHRLHQVQQFQMHGQFPQTLVALQSGRVHGRQSVERAELLAIIGCLKLAARLHLVSDSSYGLGILEQVLAGKPIYDFQRVPILT